eukprot:6864862-Heterocapsa_arctica.AAC.1
MADDVCPKVRVTYDSGDIVRKDTFVSGKFDDDRGALTTQGFECTHAASRGLNQSLTLEVRTSHDSIIALCKSIPRLSDINPSNP